MSSNLDGRFDTKPTRGLQADDQRAGSMIGTGRIVDLRYSALSLDNNTCWYINASDLTDVCCWFKGDRVDVFRTDDSGFKLRNLRTRRIAYANRDPRFKI